MGRDAIFRFHNCTPFSALLDEILSPIAAAIRDFMYPSSSGMYYLFSNPSSAGSRYQRGFYLVFLCIYTAVGVCLILPLMSFPSIYPCHPCCDEYTPSQWSKKHHLHCPIYLLLPSLISCILYSYVSILLYLRRLCPYCPASLLPRLSVAISGAACWRYGRIRNPDRNPGSFKKMQDICRCDKR